MPRCILAIQINICWYLFALPIEHDEEKERGIGWFRQGSRNNRKRHVLSRPSVQSVAGNAVKLWRHTDNLALDRTALGTLGAWSLPEKPAGISGFALVSMSLRLDKPLIQSVLFSRNLLCHYTWTWLHRCVTLLHVHPYYVNTQLLVQSIPRFILSLQIWSGFHWIVFLS